MMPGHSPFVMAFAIAIVGLFSLPAESLAHNGVDHAAGAATAIPGGNVLGLIIVAVATVAVTRHLWPSKPGAREATRGAPAERS